MSDANSRKDEILKRFVDFRVSTTQACQQAYQCFLGQDTLGQAYVSASSLQAWRTFLLDTQMPGDVLAFYVEAQNDVVVSIALASCGAFRPALKSLRSSLEGVMNALYYSDHPVELRKWKDGSERQGFTELVNYFGSHPDLCRCPVWKDLNGHLASEYSTLSRAVHASSASFRMSLESGQVQLLSSSVADLGKWGYRFKVTLSCLNTLLCLFYTDKLSGAQRHELRIQIGFCLNDSQVSKLKEHRHIVIPR